MTGQRALPADRKTSVAARPASVNGAVIGFLAGCVGIAAIWIISFAASLSGAHGIDVPFAITTTVSGTGVSITTGPGAVVIPLLCGLVGFVCGILIARKRGFSAGQN